MFLNDILFCISLFLYVYIYDKQNSIWIISFKYIYRIN